MGVETETEKQVDDSGAFFTDGRLEMSAAEQYEFDRSGYLILRDFMTPEQTESLKIATEKLEAHSNSQLPAGNGGMPLPPHKRAPWGGTYHYDEELGYHCNHVGEVDGNGANGGASTIIEDYFNADPAFDVLIDHPKTMAYINTIIQDRATINNSEIRLRYSGNYSPSHQPGAQPSGPPKGKYQYQVTNGEVDCKMVRMIYFIDDVRNEDGAFCVAPGTHKSSFPPPPDFAPSTPDDDPTMVGLEVKAGDAVVRRTAHRLRMRRPDADSVGRCSQLFTEALRHGGFAVTSGIPRKTLHVGYGPYWLMSQNIATMDEPPFITEETYQRYTDAQRALFNAWPREDRAGLSFSQRGKL
eukprot:COSAG04_NODE_105_length_25952_cov_11.965278_19_plen_355_part_00